MGDINDDVVPSCSTSKDVKREDETLLQKFVPIHVFSESSVRRMMSQDVSSRRVTTYECSQCGYQARSISALVIHARIHTGEKPYHYQCELCEKKFSTKSNVSRHILTHNDIRRFQCDLCVYKATTKHSLINISSLTQGRGLLHVINASS